jgi:hypothetical protein
MIGQRIKVKENTNTDFEMWISSHLRALVICSLLSVIWLLVAGLWERGRAHRAGRFEAAIFVF